MTAIFVFWASKKAKILKNFMTHKSGLKSFMTRKTVLKSFMTRGV